MEIYILTSMILNILGLGILLQKLSTTDYTIPAKQSKGSDYISVLCAIGFTIWAAFLVL